MAVDVIEAYENAESDAISFERPGLSCVSAPRSLALRSKLLKDLFQASADSDRVHLSVPWESLQLWLEYIQHGRGSPDGLKSGKEAADTAGLMDTDSGALSATYSGDEVSIREDNAEARTQEMADDDTTADVDASAAPQTPADSSIGLPDTMQDVCELMKVADMLIDEETIACCTVKTAPFLHSTNGTFCPAYEQALRDLPGHLQLAVIAHVPLLHILDFWASAWVPLAMRAHYPSIDASSSLSIHRLSIGHVPEALFAAAATGVNQIRNLSLAGLTLPRGIFQNICTANIGRMTWLTGLNLHDTGLQDDARECTLIRDLMNLRSLQSLDLSSNHMRCETMMGISSAISRMPHLCSLNLLNTLSVTSGEERGISYLYRSINATVLRRLTALSIGIFRHGVRFSCLPTADGVLGILASLVRMTGLQSLRLDVFESNPTADTMAHDNARHAPDVVSRLGKLSSLRSLHFTVPEVKAAYRTPFKRMGGALTQLTSLTLDFFANSRTVGYVSQVKHAAFVLAGVSSCVSLKELCVSMPITQDHEDASAPCTTLASLLPRFSSLASLRVKAYSTSETLEIEAEPGIASVNAVLQAATALSSLTRLHLPVSATHKSVRMLDRFVQSLVRIATLGTVDVSVELHTVGRADDRAGEAFALCQPLFPLVEDLRLNYRDAPAPPPGLGAAAAGLSKLRSVVLWGIEDTWPWSERGYAPFLNQLSCLRSLEQLDCMILTVDPQSDVEEDIDVEDSDEEGNEGRESETNTLQPFLRLLSGMEHLSHVTFWLENTSQAFQEYFFRSCCEMQGLRHLEVLGFDQWQWPVLEEVFPKTGVRTLIHDLGNLTDDKSAVSVKEAVRHAEHLRVLFVMGDYLFPLFDEDHLSIHDATSELPGFQLLSAKSWRTLEVSLQERDQGAGVV